MDIKKKTIKVQTEYEYYLKNLGILNQLLPSSMEKLSEKELEVLACFMSHKGDGVEEYRFNTLIRRKVMEKLNLSSGGLSNHIGELVKKHFVDKSDITKRYSVKDFVLFGNLKQGYQIAVVKDVVQ